MDIYLVNGFTIFFDYVRLLLQVVRVNIVFVIGRTQIVILSIFYNAFLRDPLMPQRFLGVYANHYPLAFFTLYGV